MKSEEGVYYSKEAYAGFLLRLLIDLIDASVVLVLCVGFSTVHLHFLLPNESSAFAILITWVSLWFAYFVLLKGSKFHTIGYRVSNTRIVNLQGDRPNLYFLTLRLVFAVIGPANILIDLIWFSGDPHRQALRDKLFTYLCH